MYLYGVKDVKSGNFAAPFVSENSESASRALCTTLMTQPDSLLKLYPDDFILYQLGIFDNETGWIERCELVRVISCAELIAQQVKKLEVVNDIGNDDKVNKTTGSESK